MAELFGIRRKTVRKEKVVSCVNSGEINLSEGEMTMDSMIVCPEPHAAEAGREVLANGGNAVDAAIAAAFVQSVTNPLMCGLGGTGLLYFYNGSTRRRTIIDCEVSIPSRSVPVSWQEQYVGRSETVGRHIISSEANQLGHQSVMVPGFVRGCWYAYERYGSGHIAWSELLSPAINLAQKGFQVYPYIANFWNDGDGEGRPGYPGTMAKLKATPDAERTYLRPAGSYFQNGDWLVQQELGQTIQRLADAGGEDFYTGDIAREISKDFDAHDGLISTGDLEHYPVYETEPLQGRYRNLEVTSTPFPSNGPTVIQMLQILDHFDLSALGHHTPEYIDTFARIQRAAFADNVQLKCMDVQAAKPLERKIISPERAAYWATRVAKGERLVLENGVISGGTTHLTCVDGERNIASFTHSIGSIAGSGVVTPGLGFLFNNFLGHYNPVPGHPDSIEAGRRFGGGVPTILFNDGEPVLAVGAPGGSRLISSVVQSLVNALDHGMGMREAVSVPRFHSEERQLLYLEPATPESVAEALRSLGNEVQRSTYMSRVQAIRIRSDGGRLEAGPDPRGGAGVGYVGSAANNIG